MTRSSGSCRESGQALIFFAVLAPVLFAILGLAIEGGLTFMEYRHMQAAADMAAIVGAQDLPSNMSGAITDACMFAQNNGYDDCATSGPSTTQACVPPQSLSPYAGLSYGSGNSGCTNTGTGQFNYIEVQIRKPVNLFPIFSQYLGLANFTLYAHAIARAGTPSPTDYAITILDPTDPSALSLSGGTSVVIVGPVISDSTGTNSINTGGNGPQVACNGEWFTTAAETTPKNLFTQTGGTSDFSPPGCLPSGSYDSTTLFYPDSSPVPDPYCSSFSPPTGIVASTDCNGNSGPATTMTNCTPCNSTAFYYEWTPTSTAPNYGRDKGTWYQATGDITMSNDSYELFPGIYRGSITVNTGSKPSIYLNPGVYTITGSGGLTMHGGFMCVFGSPSCDVNPGASLVVHSSIPGASSTTTCSNADLTNTGASTYVSPGTWYYYCSPWGIWDSNPPNGTNGPPSPGPGTAAPTFYNSSTPLNGVTFYFTGAGSKGSCCINTNGTNLVYGAFPNPCPGTGTLSNNSVSFQSEVDPTVANAGEPSGAVPGASSEYVYPSMSLPSIEGMASSPSNEWIYPDTNLTLNGECEEKTPNNYAGDVWQGEMPTLKGIQGQHVHFLIFARSQYAGISMNGNGLQNWWGVLYDPGVAGCYKSGNPCQVSLNGGSGSVTPGPPMLVGQIVADNATITGNAGVEVFYRPCDPTVESCQNGPGSGLVQ